MNLCTLFRWLPCRRKPRLRGAISIITPHLIITGDNMDFSLDLGNQVPLAFVLKDADGNVHPDPTGAKPTFSVDDKTVGDIAVIDGAAFYQSAAAGSNNVSAIEGKYSASAKATVVPTLTGEIDAGPETPIPPAAA